MAATNPSALALSEPDRHVLEAWLTEFDRAWQEGSLADRLLELSTLPAALHFPALVEMVKLDLSRQWQRGVRASLESYLEAHPQLGNPYTVPIDLIQAEFEARQRLGEAPDLADYARRFPGRIDELRRLLTQARETTSWTTDEPRRATPPPRPITSPPPVPGALPEQFGRYRILRKLGQGGMGTVYLAHDAQFDRQVALKVPHISPEDGPEVIERFYREARAAAVLHHPNFCPVYEVGEFDGIPYLTMAYLEGRSLAEVVRDGALPPERAAALTRTLAAALEETHRRGVIHRDLKPSNVLLTNGGDPVILDFGLARRTGRGDVRLTQSGALVGTPAYIAPEQLTGKSEPAPACDIYSLGAMLYELLTGRPPFLGSLEAVLSQALLDEPVPPSSLRPEVGPKLNAACLKALAKKPEDRHASMAAFAAALDDSLRATPVLSGPTVTLSAPAVVSARRSLRWLWVSAAGLLAVVLGVVIWFKINVGTVHVSVDLPGAEILVDGERIKEGQEKIRLSPGEHKLIVRLNGVPMDTRSIFVRRWEHEDVHVEITREMMRKNMNILKDLPGFGTFPKLPFNPALDVDKDPFNHGKAVEDLLKGIKPPE